MKKQALTCIELLAKLSNQLDKHTLPQNINRIVLWRFIPKDLDKVLAECLSETPQTAQQNQIASF